MKSAEQIEHKGIVLSVEEGIVRVAIEVNEACGSCASRKACSMGQSEKREITVYTADASDYSVGEQVEVGAKQTLGVVAVLLCYVVPLVVLVASLLIKYEVFLLTDFTNLPPFCSIIETSSSRFLT